MINTFGRAANHVLCTMYLKADNW